MISGGTNKQFFLWFMFFYFNKQKGKPKMLGGALAAPWHRPGLIILLKELYIIFGRL
jgi:hypothetical protein